MKTRTIFLILLIVAATFLIGFPNHDRKTLRADEGYTGIVNCAVWFPYVTHTAGYDTGISIAGDSTSLPEGIPPEITVYYYDADHNTCTMVNQQHLAKGPNSQWAAMISQLTQNSASGSLLVLTNIPHVQAVGFVVDGTTGALASVPAIADYTIAGVNNYKIVRRPGCEPPDGWQMVDLAHPEETSIDPSMYHTTLIYPFVVHDANDYFDTGIVIASAISSPRTSGNTASLYIYDISGALARKVVLNLGGSPSTPVVPACTVLLSALMALPTGNNVVDYSTFSGQGWIMAVVNVPYAQGYECFFSAGPMTSGYAATIDNNIHGVDGTTHEPLRINAPASDGSTSIIMPYVTTANGCCTFATVANTLKALDENGDPRTVTADIYLYNMDGSIAKANNVDCHWTQNLYTGNVNAMLTIYMPPGGDVEVNGVSKGVLDTNFEGWLLIIVNAPGAYGAANVGSSTPNTLMSYPGEPEPGITGVSLQTGTKYNILWNNPVPIDTPNSIPLSYWADSGGATTHVNVVPLRNRSEFTGSTVPYTVHPTRQNYNPETQNPIPNVTASPLRGTPPGVGPASGWLRVPAQQNPADPYGTGVIDAPPNSHVTATLVTLYDIELITSSRHIGRITTPVNLVGTETWNSIILRAESPVDIIGAMYKWEIVSDSTHVDRGNLRQGGDPENYMIESEANWVEFTAESLSTALNDVKVKVTYILPTGYPLWQDSATFTTADIRYLAYIEDPEDPYDLGWRIRSLIPVDVYEVGSSSQDLHFFRVAIGLSNSIPELSTSTVSLKLAAMDAEGAPLDSGIYFREIPDLEMVEHAPENPLSGVTYYTTVKEIGAIVVLFTNTSDIPSALGDPINPSPSQPRRYVVHRYGGTLRPFLLVLSES